MPATATALDAARSAAELYADSIVAERHLLAMLPAPGHPDRAVVEGSLGDVGRVAREAFGRYRGAVLDLLASGDVIEASEIINGVQDRTRRARTPIEITISEEDRC
jgi:hypothetical protein